MILSVQPTRKEKKRKRKRILYIVKKIHTYVYEWKRQSNHHPVVAIRTNQTPFPGGSPCIPSCNANVGMTVKMKKSEINSRRL